MAALFKSELLRITNVYKVAQITDGSDSTVSNTDSNKGLKPGIFHEAYHKIRKDPDGFNYNTSKENNGTGIGIAKDNLQQQVTGTFANRKSMTFQ